MVLEIEGARLKRVECERKDLEQEFWDYCHTDENSDRVGELDASVIDALPVFIGRVVGCDVQALVGLPGIGDQHLVVEPQRQLEGRSSLADPGRPDHDQDRGQ